MTCPGVAPLSLFTVRLGEGTVTLNSCHGVSVPLFYSKRAHKTSVSPEPAAAPRAAFASSSSISRAESRPPSAQRCDDAGTRKSAGTRFPNRYGSVNESWTSTLPRPWCPTRQGQAKRTEAAQHGRALVQRLRSFR